MYSQVLSWESSEKMMSGRGRLIVGETRWSYTVDTEQKHSMKSEPNILKLCAGEETAPAHIQNRIQALFYPAISPQDHHEIMWEFAERPDHSTGQRVFFVPGTVLISPRHVKTCSPTDLTVPFIPLWGTCHSVSKLQRFSSVCWKPWEIGRASCRERV